MVRRPLRPDEVELPVPPSQEHAPAIEEPKKKRRFWSKAFGRGKTDAQDEKKSEPAKKRAG